MRHSLDDILAAPYDRERTGRGARLHVPMIGALGEWMSQPAYFKAGIPPESGTAAQAYARGDLPA